MIRPLASMKEIFSTVVGNSHRRFGKALMWITGGSILILTIVTGEVRNMWWLWLWFWVLSEIGEALANDVIYAQERYITALKLSQKLDSEWRQLHGIQYHYEIKETETGDE